MEGSQISLPRSYTLPREFKYHHPNNNARERRNGNNKVPSRFYLPSTNSSDGDVDSADNEEETDSELHFRVKNGCRHENRYAFENGKIDICNLNLDSTRGAITQNNSYGVLRPNPFFRTRVKHETKL